MILLDDLPNRLEDGKVMTADEHLMPNGTAVITDVGRTGSSFSVGGLDPEIEVRKFLTAVPERSKDAWEALMLQAVIMEMSSEGKAVSIERIQVPCEDKHDD